MGIVEIDINSNIVHSGSGDSMANTVVEDAMIMMGDRLGTSSLNDNNESDAKTVADTISCSCRICDPFCRIWAFPLKKSCSDPTSTASSSSPMSPAAELVTDAQPNPDVGIIGSHRMAGPRNEWRTSLGLSPSSSSIDSKFGTEATTRKNSLSDSGDSGCDILSGLNLSTDFLNNMDEMALIEGSTTTTTTANIYGFATDTAFADTVNELSNDMINAMQFKSDFLQPAECLINANTIFEFDSSTKIQ